MEKIIEKWSFINFRLNIRTSVPAHVPTDYAAEVKKFIWIYFTLQLSFIKYKDNCNNSSKESLAHHYDNIHLDFCII